jgi:hypothetical protein
MAGRNDTDYYKKLLLDFIAEPDPLFSMLQWLTQRMMELESESKAGAPKGKHCAERKTHFSGTRVRRFDTRLGTMYLLVPKLRQGGYIPFFVTERKRGTEKMSSNVHIKGEGKQPEIEQKKERYSQQFDFSEIIEAGSYGRELGNTVTITKPDGTYMKTFVINPYGETNRIFTDEPEQIIAWVGDDGDWMIEEEFEDYEEEPGEEGV